MSLKSTNMEDGDGHGSSSSRSGRPMIHHSIQGQSERRLISTILRLRWIHLSGWLPTTSLPACWTMPVRKSRSWSAWSPALTVSSRWLSLIWITSNFSMITMGTILATVFWYIWRKNCGRGSENAILPPGLAETSFWSFWNIGMMWSRLSSGSSRSFPATTGIWTFQSAWGLRKRRCSARIMTLCSMQQIRRFT